MLKNRLIGVILSAIMLASVILAAVPLESEAVLETANIWGFVGVSATDAVTPPYMNGMTVVLYKAFDLYGLEEVERIDTSSGQNYDFYVTPGYYVLGVEPATIGSSLYHINEDVYPEGLIPLGLVDYGTHTRKDVPLKEELVNAHFYGQITEGGVPVQNANVTISDPAIGFNSGALTDITGNYIIDVYQDTFDLKVSVGDTARYYDNLTVADITDTNETFVLSYPVFNDVYSISILGGGVESSVWDNGMGSFNLSVLNASNNNHLIVMYDRAIQNDQVNITSNYTGDQNSIDLGGKIDTNITIYNGTENDPANWTVLVEGTDYNVTHSTGELNITAANLTDTDFVYVNYTRIYSEVEDLGFIGRNVKDVDIAFSQIDWTTLNVTTGAPLPASTDVEVVFYNKVTKNIYTQRTDPVFTMDVPNGSYIVVIRPDGYETYTNTSLIVAGDNYYSTTFSPIDISSERTTELVFPGDDWNNLSVTWTNVLNSYDHFAGLGDNFQNIRLQIDSIYGNGDGSLSITEVDAFEADLKDNKHPELYTTEDFFTFNGTGATGTAYSAIGASYQVSLAIPDLGGGTTFVDVDDNRPVTLTISLSYTSNENIQLDRDLYAGEMIIAMDSGEYRISLPATYANRGSVNYNVPVAPGKVDVVLDSSGDDFGITPLSIGRISAPGAVISVGSIPTIAKNNGTIFFVRDSTIVPFNGEDSSVVNGTIVGYMWDWGDGSPATSWSAFPNATHNFTTSYPAGRTVTLTVEDSAGQIASTSVTIVPDGEAPTIVISTNHTWAGQGESIEFNSTGTNDGVASEYDNLSFEWVFGDGSISSANVSSHSFSNPGDYTVYLNVTDEVGNVRSSSVMVHINDTTAPTAQVIADRNVEEDKVVVFNASASHDGEGSIVNYTWDFRNGVIVYGIEATHTFSDPGEYTIFLNVTDEAGNVGTLPVQMNVLSGPRPNIELSAINIVGKAVNGKETIVQVVINNSGTANCTLPITVSLYETVNDKDVLIGNATVDPLAVGEKGIVEIIWTPSEQGSHVLTANASSAEDASVYNNVKAESVTVDPNVVEAYGTTFVILAVIIVILVLILGREKIKDAVAASAEKKKQKANLAEKDRMQREKETREEADNEDAGDKTSP